MQPWKTGDQPYSDASPYSECSLIHILKFTTHRFSSVPSNWIKPLSIAITTLDIWFYSWKLCNLIPPIWIEDHKLADRSVAHRLQIVIWNF